MKHWNDHSIVKSGSSAECHTFSVNRDLVNTYAYSALGPMRWQKAKQYGKRNVSENAMQRYKTIIGPKLHSREFENQQQEMMLAASILNRFTQLGMPESYRVA